MHGDDQARDDGAAPLQAPDELLLRDPGHGATQEEVVEPVEILQIKTCPETPSGARLSDLLIGEITELTMRELYFQSLRTDLPRVMVKPAM